MPQTFIGAMKSAAKWAGMSFEDYRSRIQAGEKRCRICKVWKPLIEFSKDRTRHDGKCPKCFQCSRVKEPKSHKGRVSTFKGKRHSPETIAKLSAMRKGVPNLALKGKRPSLETRAKISATLRRTAARGPSAPGYIDGKGVERQGDRASDRAKQWRYDVFLRDEFMCVHCGDDRGGNLNAHHRKPWAKYPHLRFDVGNGVTLCKGCHWLVHTYALGIDDFY